MNIGDFEFSCVLIDNMILSREDKNLVKALHSLKVKAEKLTKTGNISALT